MKQTLALLPALGIIGLLAGCAPETSAPTEAQSCLAASYQGLIGGTEEDALDTLVDLFLLGDNEPDVRYISPGDAVTMDFRPERMNIALDTQGIVTRVYCG